MISFAMNVVEDDVEENSLHSFVRMWHVSRYLNSLYFLSQAQLSAAF